MTDESREEKESQAKWYVVHTYSGYENKVKDNIEKMIENKGMNDDIFEVYIPTEEYVDKSGSGGKLRERKLFPGYVLVKMINNNDSWYLVRNTRGVTGFVGPGSEPVPLTESEVRALGVKEAKLPPIDFEVGEVVKIISGPYKDETGSVKSINNEKRRVTVLVSMCSRETPYELDFEQLSKI